MGVTDERGAETLEIERKFEARAGLKLPDAGAFAAAGFTADDPKVHQLAARYFDTPDGALARLGLAVRTRSGGTDDGWHLKQRDAAGVREFAWSPCETMPDGLRSEIEARIGPDAARLALVAELLTERTAVLLRDAFGGECVEIADDRVRALDGTTGTRRAWREWEAELMPGASPDALERVQPVLIAAGATPSLSFAKIARATGRLLAVARAEGADAEQLAALERLDASDRQAARSVDA